MDIVLRMLLIVFLGAAGGLGTAARDPAFAAMRPWPLIGAIAASLAMFAIVLRCWRSDAPDWRVQAVPAVLGLALALSSEARFQFDRERVLAADAHEIAELGRHLIVGYRTAAELMPLVERGAIGGIFIAPHNIRGRGASDIAAEIAMLQAIHRRHGRPPLWVAADQEGGLVSRMSPPLPRQPSLRVLAAQPDGARAAAIAAYARQQGEGLARLGVNLNFSPVVDLDHSVVDASDRYTRITERAISRDPVLVTEIAGGYCAGLAAAGIRCTLKHFPGLGRVRGDTHIAGADLTASLAELEAADWIPFRQLIGYAATPAIMLAHVRLAALDPKPPLSISKRTVDGLVRREWGFDGILVTDDLCMGAFYNDAKGLRAGAVSALNAGVDLLLVSWDGAQYYKVMSALIAARRLGRFDASMLAASRRRLDAAR